MKKLLLMLIICLIAFSLLLKSFLADLKEGVIFPEQNIETLSSENKEEQTPESEKEENVISEDKTSDNKASGPDEKEKQLYRMLDFDRRLILNVGEQDDWLCSIFNLAYARAILDEDYDADPYDYFDGEGAVWRWADFEDIALDNPLPVVLQLAYDEITQGRPVIFFVSGTYARTVGSQSQMRSSEDHYVLLIGCRTDADYKDLKASDFYAVDPAKGYGSVPWVILSDAAPAKTSGEYALYAPSDKREHVSTCLAYEDECEWDESSSQAIHPLYAEAENEEECASAKGC